jgi:hypothetical protein
MLIRTRPPLKWSSVAAAEAKLAGRQYPGRIAISGSNVVVRAVRAAATVKVSGLGVAGQSLEAVVVQGHVVAALAALDRVRDIPEELGIAAHGRPGLLLAEPKVVPMRLNPIAPVELF